LEYLSYDQIEAKIVRQFKRHGITPEDPENYSTRYGNSLLDTKDLLAKVQELGITEDIVVCYEIFFYLFLIINLIKSVPQVLDHEFQEELKSNSSEQNISYENSFQQPNFENENYPSENIVYNDLDNYNYAPTYDNLFSGSLSSTDYDDFLGQESMMKYLFRYEFFFYLLDIGEDLSTQLAQYGLTTESIPY